MPSQAADPAGQAGKAAGGGWARSGLDHSCDVGKLWCWKFASDLYMVPVL